MATTVGNFSLTNIGGFVARVYFQYTDPEGNLYTSGIGPDIDTDQTVSVNPGSIGVPHGSTIYFNVDVVWGTNVGDSSPYIYDTHSNFTANYTISGMLDNSRLILKGITEHKDVLQ